MGYLVLTVLSALALLAAVSVARRAYPDRTAEQALTALVIWVTLLVGPVHALGWLGQLRELPLALVSLVSSGATLMAGLAGREVRRGVRDTLHDTGRLLALPVSALRRAWKQRSFAFVGLLLCYGIWLWTAWLSWIAPASGWDGLTYHQPIIYFAIQNGGFELVDAPSAPISQQINTAPRLGHCLSMWWTIFADRRLVELGSSVMAVLLLVGSYVVARRYTRSTDAMGYASALFLIPTLALQLRSTYQDLSFGATFIVAAAYVTRPTIRVRDAWMGALALGLMGGFKFTGLALVPLYGLVLLGRVVAGLVRGRRLVWTATVVGGLGLVAALMVPIYARNWLVYDNIVWPRDFRFESLGVHFEGAFEPYHRKPFDRVVGDLFSPPEDGKQYPDSRDNGYGNGAPFVVLPLCVAAILALFGRVLMGCFRSRAPPSRRTWWLVALVVPAAIVFAISPSYHWARYNVHAIIVAFLLVAWLLRRPAVRRVSEATFGALIVVGGMTLAWSEPGWAVDFDQALVLSRGDRMDRAAVQLRGGFNMLPELARRRERVIGPGDVVAYSEHSFLGTLWNEDVTNEVRYVPWPGKGSDYLRRLDEMSAEWVGVHLGGRGYRVLRRDRKWEYLGRAIGPHRALVVFERKPRAR